MSVRGKYESIGVDKYYLEYGEYYKNPHFETVKKLIKSEDVSGKVLDLSCGNGEATLCLDCSQVDVVGCDPYLYNSYTTNTSNTCYTYSFDDIINGKMRDVYFDIIICSFAMHLCEESKLDSLLYELACISDELIIVTPNKKPYINNNYWNKNKETMVDRVRLRRYNSVIKL